MAPEREPTNQGWLNLTLHCPACGSRLGLRVMDVDDEDPAEVVWLLLLDCPLGDYHGTLTQHDVARLAAAEILRRLRTGK
jgi:hypothetical protein